MPKSRPPYPDEFRREAVQMVRGGRTIPDVAGALGVTEQSLRNCRLCGIPHNRHTFVLRTLLSWYREDRDVEAQLPLLSTFLGHVDPSSTYWYFEGAPQLLALAAERLERTWEQLP